MNFKGQKKSSNELNATEKPVIWLEQLREPGARGRADLLYKQLDLLLPLRQEARAAMLTESRKHPAHKILCSIPSLGPVRVALLLALLQTPYRFRGKRQLWTYAGLALGSATPNKKKVGKVSKEDVGVPDMILFLKRTLSALPKRQTLALVPLFERQHSRRAMICLFLAILEMVKQQAIHLTQSESFGEINIRRDEKFDEMLAADEDAARIEQEYKS